MIDATIRRWRKAGGPVCPCNRATGSERDGLCTACRGTTALGLSVEDARAEKAARQSAPVEITDAMVEAFLDSVWQQRLTISVPIPGPDLGDAVRAALRAAMGVR